MAGTIPDDEQRSEALAAIAEWLAVIDPAQAAALIDQALAVAETIPDDWQRRQALAASPSGWLPPTPRPGADRPGPGRGQNHPRRLAACAARRWPASPSGWLPLTPRTRR